MSKSNAIQAQYSAEIHINLTDVELILATLNEKLDTYGRFPLKEEVRHIVYLIEQFKKLYNELKGGKHETNMA